MFHPASVSYFKYLAICTGVQMKLYPAKCKWNENVKWCKTLLWAFAAVPEFMKRCALALVGAIRSSIPGCIFAGVPRH
eukprot:980841-Rhodomonas_salina.1